MRSRREREAKAHWRPELFTNREAELAAFRALLDDPSPHHASVLAHHGISGNGKSWLARQFRHELRERPAHARVPHAFVDLDGAADLADHEFLLAVRNGLAETGDIRFNAFDIAFVLFWSLLPDQRPLPRLTGSLLAPEGGDLARLLADRVEVGELGGLIASGLPLVRHLGNGFVRWLTKTQQRAANAVLRALLDAQDDLSARAVLLRLPHLLAADVADWRHATPARPVAIICDTWETTRAQGGAARSTESIGPVEEMLRDLVAELPYCAVAVLGRERLDWPADAAAPAAALAGGEHRLDGLARAPGDDYLQRREITNADVRAAMLDTATVGPAAGDEVFPLFLDLLAGLHDDLAAKGAPPTPSDFAFAIGGDLDARTRRIVDRVVRDYDDPLKAMLQRLGVARRFDRELAAALDQTFALGFALRRFDDLAALSLVEAEDGGYALHARIADCLAARLDADARLETHRRLDAAFVERADAAAAAADGRAAVAALGRAVDHAAADPAVDLGASWAAIFDAFGPRVGVGLFEPLARRMVEVFERADGAARGRAIAFNILGDVRVARGDLGGALAAYEAGLAIFERLAAGDPSNSAWQRDLSVSFDRIGNMRVARGDLGGALAAYEACHSILKALAARDPSHTGWQRNLSVSHEKIGNVLVARGDLGGALAIHEAGLTIAERLATGDPSNSLWQRDLSVSHEKIGDVRTAQGDLAGALGAYAAGLGIRERLAAGDPSNTEWQRDLSVSHNKLGDVRRAQGELGAALAAYEAGLAIRARLAAGDAWNTEWQRDLSVSHEKIGDVRRAQGDLAGALTAYEAGLAIAERLAARDPSHTGWQRDLSVSHEKIGDVRTAQGELAAALSAYEAGHAIREQLAAGDPSNSAWQRDLFVSHSKIGDVRRAQGDLAGALEAYEAGLAIAERLTAGDPSNTEWQRDLITGNVRLAQVAEAQDDAVRAAGRYRAGLAIAHKLAAEGRLAPRDAWMPEDLRRRLSALGG